MFSIFYIFQYDLKDRKWVIIPIIKKKKLKWSVFTIEGPRYSCLKNVYTLNGPFFSDNQKTRVLLHLF